MGYYVARSSYGFYGKVILGGVGGMVAKSNFRRKFEIGDVIVTDYPDSGNIDMGEGYVVKCNGQGYYIKDGEGVSRYLHLMSLSYNWKLKEEENTMFKKEDIKVGMRVLLQISGGDTEYRIVMDNCEGELILSRLGSWGGLDGYNQNLCDGGLKIMRIYNRPRYNQELLDPKACGLLLWERTPPVKEVTMEEIAKAFDCDVKSLKITKGE